MELFSLKTSNMFFPTPRIYIQGWCVPAIIICPDNAMGMKCTGKVHVWRNTLLCQVLTHMSNSLPLWHVACVYKTELLTMFESSCIAWQKYVFLRLLSFDTCWSVLRMKKCVLHFCSINCFVNLRLDLQLYW